MICLCPNTWDKDTQWCRFRAVCYINGCQGDLGLKKVEPLIQCSSATLAVPLAKKTAINVDISWWNLCVHWYWLSFINLCNNSTHYTALSVNKYIPPSWPHRNCLLHNKIYIAISTASSSCQVKRTFRQYKPEHKRCFKIDMGTYFFVAFLRNSNS